MTSPLINMLIEQHHYPLLTEDKLDSFLQRHEYAVLFFTEEPSRYPESNDVAVILPELEAAFPHRFTPAVVDRSLEPALKGRYDINVWPTLVFLRNGRYLGKISKVRDWSVYMELISDILDREPTSNPGLGIPVVTEQRDSSNA